MYIAHDASRPEVIIFFNGIWIRHDTGIELDSIPASRCVRAQMTSGRDAAFAIYCEPGLTDSCTTQRYETDMPSMFIFELFSIVVFRLCPHLRLAASHPSNA